MPPNRPQNAQNGRESGFPGSAGCWGGEHDLDGCHPVGQGPTHGRILNPAPVTAKLPAGGPSRITSAGPSATTGLRSARGPRDGVRGLEHLAARRSRGGPETPGSEGAQPPASLRRGLTECGHTG